MLKMITFCICLLILLLSCNNAQNKETSQDGNDSSKTITEKNDSYTTQSNDTVNKISQNIQTQKNIGKQMYAIVVFSTFDSSINDKIAHFTDIFIVDSEITSDDEVKIIENKTFEYKRKVKNSEVIDHKLKCFDTTKEVHQYVENFRLGLRYRPTDISTFDSIANYTTERAFLRNYYNMEE